MQVCKIIYKYTVHHVVEMSHPILHLTTWYNKNFCNNNNNNNDSSVRLMWDAALLTREHSHPFSSC